MDLDEWKALWAAHDRKLDRLVRLNREALRASSLGRVRSALKGRIFGLALEAILTFVAICFLNGFVYQNLREIRFALPGGMLSAVAIALFQSLVRQIAMASQIDYNRPVAVLQQEIERLRMLQIRTTQRILLVSPLLWAALPIVALKGLLDLDAYRIFPAAWLVANLVFGVAFIVALLWLSKRLHPWIARSRFWQSLIDALAGHSLKAAAAEVETLAAFEEEARDRP